MEGAPESCARLLSVASERQSNGSHLALSRQRHERREPDGAEVIDLVHLPRGTRPTPIAYLDFEEVERLREMGCEHYQSCLTFAAEVRWRSFHCRQCPENPARKALASEQEAAPSPAAAAKIIELP